MVEILLNPNTELFADLDEESKEIMRITIEFFENKGKVKCREDDAKYIFYDDFLDFLKKEKIFSRLLTPTPYGDGKTRWDTFRNLPFNEILGFYGLHYWYTWQVSILGLGPIFLSNNEDVKKNTGKLLEDGGVFAFGLSEKDHGADIYSTDMVLTKHGENNYTANGSKYYIGNGNIASYASMFGKVDPPWDPEDKKYGSYVFFVADSQHEKYECVRNLVNVQSYVAEFKLNDYPITENEILAKGRDAWDAALNTVNIGKFNLGLAAIGICTHAFYESITHASNRILYGSPVTVFPHVKSFFVDAYCKLVAMKLFAYRATDYFRMASLEDRRYLLFNPMVKMKVTTMGEEVINNLWEVIAARGFENETYFSSAARDIRALPKLEGTVHVNMALIIKFLQNYFYKIDDTLPEIPTKVNKAVNDDFLFKQGQTSGLSKIQFLDYRKVYDQWDTPNINIFKEQIKVFREMGKKEGPTLAQWEDFDFLLQVGEIFTLIVYGQLILENVKAYEIQDILIEQIFDNIVRDCSKYALQLYNKPGTTEAQMEYCLKMIKKPSNTKKDQRRFKNVWKIVKSYNGAYEMKK